MRPNSKTYGTVKWYDKNKGYGFIKRDDGQKDVFLHITTLEKAGMDAIDDGQKVKFDIEMKPKGASAINLELA